jgi:hypothetical protein
MSFIKSPICPYCQSKTILQPDTYIYNRSYGNPLYVCQNYPFCDSYVGTHNDGSPKGIPANKQLRSLRICTHNVFDYYWKSNILKRSTAYRILSEILGIDYDDCHIALFNEKLCIKTIEICNNNLLQEYVWYKRKRNGILK